MIRHKLIGLLLIGLFVFALVACGTESAETPDQTESISSTDVSNENKVADSHQNAERVLNVAMTFLDEPPDICQREILSHPRLALPVDIQPLWDVDVFPRWRGRPFVPLPAEHDEDGQCSSERDAPTQHSSTPITW